MPTPPPVPAHAPGWLARFAEGFATPWTGLRYMNAHPTLWRHGLLPVLCNLLLSAGTLFSSDIYKRFINPQCDQARQLLMTRACIIISGILTLGLAMSVSSILGTIMIGLSLTAAFSVIVIVALFFPQYASKAAGFWTLLAGLVLLVLWQLTPAVRIFPNVIYMEWLVCIAAYAIAAIVCPAKKAVAVEGN